MAVVVIILTFFFISSFIFNKYILIRIFRAVEFSAFSLHASTAGIIRKINEM